MIQTPRCLNEYPRISVVYLPLPESIFMYKLGINEGSDKAAARW